MELKGSCGTIRWTMSPSQPPRGADAATSQDGRTFSFTMSPDHLFPIGSFVSLSEVEGVTRLGLVEAHHVLPGGDMQAAGRVLGVVDAKGLDSTATSTFAAATVAEADPDMVSSLNNGAGATLHIGSIASNADLPARLIPRRLNRHTFWCGQSGSGKTYALGVLLEEVLLHTELPMIIFDPNGDFVRLGDVREDAPRERTDQLMQRGICVLRPRSQPGDDLRVRFTDLELPAKAAVMRLDPLIDRIEYNTALHLEELLS